MAFVKCSTYKADQAEQNNRLDALEACCESNSTKNDAQDKEIEALKQAVADNAQANSDKDSEQDNAIEALQQQLKQAEDTNNVQEEQLKNLEQCCSENKQNSEALDAKLAKLANLDSSLQINENGIGVRISQLENNVLQLKEDGLFMSNNPNDYYQSFHIHAAQGNDETGDGSKERPYRTVDKALSVMKNIPSYVDLFLYKGLTYDAGGNYYNRFKTFCNISIHAYDEATPSAHGVSGYPYVTSTNAYYRGHIAKSYPRPTLRFKTKVEHELRSVSRPSIMANKIAAFGIALLVDDRVDNDITEYSGNFSGCLEAISTVELLGCTLEWIAPSHISTSGVAAYRTDVLLRGEILWINSLLKTDLTAGQYKTGLVSSSFTQSFRAIDWHGANLEGYGEAPNYETLTGSFEGVTQNIKPDVIASNGSAFVNGVTFNFNING